MPDLECRQRLGEELRRLRKAAGAKTREVYGDSKSGHISNVEQGKTLPSSDLVDIYIRKFSGDSATLYALYQAAVDESNKLKEEQRRERYATAPEEEEMPGDPCSPAAITRRYRIETKEASYSFNGEGVIEELRLNYTIRARTPKTMLFYESFRYGSDQRQGILKPEAGQGCQLEKAKESDDGALKVYLSLDKEINPGDTEPHVFSYRVLVRSSVRATPVLFYMPGSMTVLRYSLRAQFHSPALPAPIWWFAASGSIGATDNDHPERVFPPEPSGYYFKEFHKPISGWCYGLGWQWPLG